MAHFCHVLEGWAGGGGDWTKIYHVSSMAYTHVASLTLCLVTSISPYHHQNVTLNQIFPLSYDLNINLQEHRKTGIE